MKKFCSNAHVMATALAALPTTCLAQNSNAQKPNIVIINIDDMGYSDPYCFGGNYAPTPNIDKMAEEGLSLKQFYTSCPISSPSRAGLTTGMYPTRWGITTFLQDRAGNAANNQNDYLDSKAPSMARALKSGGYTTGHFGKWHMGGGRDVYNAPAIPLYGFDEYSSTWESPDPDPKLTASNWIWCDNDEVKRWNRTAYFVDKTLDFLERHKGKPCFVNLWPDDVHTPWVYEGDEKSQRESKESFAIVLAELDVQIGRFMDGLKRLGLDENTIVIFTGDNGPAPSFDGYRTNSFRGQKGTLYEGGIRMPFIIRWPGVIEPNQVNTTSVVNMVDLFPSLCSIVDVEISEKYPLDGLDMSKVLLGQSTEERQSAMFWEFGLPLANRVSPHIAVREGKWKLLVNADGSSTELYDMETDINELNNVSLQNPTITERLKKMAIDWFNEAYRQYADNIIRIAVDGDETADGSSWDKATTLENAINIGASVSGSQIWLKEGVYNLMSSIVPDNLKFYGGFAGDENKLRERNWMEHPSIVDGGGKIAPFRNNKLDGNTGTVIDGLIIQNGVNQAGANGNGNGGGAILSAGATVRNCIFRNNRTQNGKNGAAIHCHAGSVTIENSLFENNTSSGNGGAVQVGGGTTATIINCTFVNNVASGPGGAFGLGSGDSNINIYNTIAYNNIGKGERSSYGQNTNINGGGKVISKYSAIESESTKFTDGDDIEHIVLNENVDPGFEAPVLITGCVSDDSDFEAIVNASYLLTETSNCIDKGNINLTSKLSYDLKHENRLSGTQIDLGAYEYDKGDVIEIIPVIHVAIDGDENSDGSSWELATTLEHAVTLGSSYIGNGILWLKSGIYYPASTINVDKLEIYGGFSGTETELNERNWELNPTIIDGGGNISPLRNSSLEKPVTTVLDGIIIQNGVNHSNANGNGNGGGAILTNGAVVKNCVFRNNRTVNGKNGAGLHCHIGQVRVENSLFVNNTSSGNGGALQVGGGATSTVINCTFANNNASKGGGAFGLGNNESNINIYNTIAYNNIGGGKRNSLSQNDNINGGGKVVSMYSAIEGESNKLCDADDFAYLVLNETISPCFERAASFTGYTDQENLFAEILDASYELGKMSPCINVGDNNYAALFNKDLAFKDRVIGDRIDMGAYEADEQLAVDLVTDVYEDGDVKYIDGRIVVSNVPDSSVINVYSSAGTLLFSKSGIKKNYTCSLKYDGIIIVTLNGKPYKFDAK